MNKPVALVALTDAQILQIQRCALPLNRQDRGAYLEKVLEMLDGHEIGDGLVARAAREAQHMFLRSPELEPRNGRLMSKWDRSRPRFERQSKRDW
jgi:hypothetical protein